MDYVGGLEKQENVSNNATYQMLATASNEPNGSVPLLFFAMATVRWIAAFLGVSHGLILASAGQFNNGLICAGVSGLLGFGCTVFFMVKEEKETGAHVFATRVLFTVWPVVFCLTCAVWHVCNTLYQFRKKGLKEYWRARSEEAAS